MKNETFNIDCIDYMRKCRDKQFNLAIVDPPYGIKELTGRNAAGGKGKLKNRILNKKADDVIRWDKPVTGILEMNESIPLNIVACHGSVNNNVVLHAAPIKVFQSWRVVWQEEKE